jgi:serine/threonine protein kinase
MRNWSNLTINFDELVIDKRVGSGAQGVVHKGSHRGQDVAIKVLNSQDDLSEEEMKDFREEVKWLSSIRCAYVVLLVGVCIHPPHLSVITEFMPRGSMYELLHKTKSDVGFPRRMRMLLDVIKGMQYLEAASIVHRDLKSQNILIDRSFRAKVADFGLARLCQDSLVQTVNGAAGTPGWMAPETLRDEAVVPKSDVYSFGVVSLTATPVVFCKLCTAVS